MDLLLRPDFWLAALAAYVLMRAPWPAPPMRRYGALNLGVLFVLLGARAALGAALVSLLAWAGLAWYARARAQASAGRQRVAALAVYLAGVIGVFVLHKLDLEWRAAGAALLPTALLVRLSYSFVFLRLCDAARSLAGGARLLDPLSLLGYLFPFHMLLAGPVGVYREHVLADARPLPEPGFAALVAGVNTITTGLFYKLVLAEALRVFAFGLNGPLASRSLADSALLFVYLFFDFAGYSLVALGIGRLLGVPTPVNFDRPWLSQSLTDFWHRWHASLGQWVRAHIFMPLQTHLVRAWGPRRAPLAALPVLVVSFAFVGAWHGLHPALLAWGLGVGACLALEKVVRDRCLRHAWAHAPATTYAVRVLGPVYVFVAMTLTLHPVWRYLL